MISESGKNISKLFLHEKPFLLLKVINDSKSPVYAAGISKKIDCSYAYIVRLLKMMNKLGLTSIEETNHKKIISLTQKGKKIFNLLSEVN